MTVPLLEVRGLHQRFNVRSHGRSNRPKTIEAVKGVAFSINPGETLGLVGESGCGKSSLARATLFLDPPVSGEVLFDGELLTRQKASDLRRRAQIVLQDPYTSLPPRMRIGRILAEPFLIHQIGDRADIRDRVAGLLHDVGLKADLAESLPHELSGGQRQRVGIARALAVEPSLIVADEAVSSLDVSVQAQILNLLKDLQERHGLTYLFISHDLAVVKYMSHRIAVMYLGKVVELAPAEEIYARPLHPYTRALMAAVPSVRRRGAVKIRLAGEPPDPSAPPPGCSFHPRCPMAQEVCRSDEPGLEEWLPGRVAACHFALDERPTTEVLESAQPAQRPGGARG